MDGASLPVLAASQTLTAMGAAASGSAPVAGLRDGFAAILGATELTGLPADQQAALTRLLADPAGTLRSAAEAVGKELPEAAIRGLLGALGVALDPQAFGTDASAPTAKGQLEPRTGNEAEGRSDLAATLLATLLSPAPTSGAQEMPPPFSTADGEAADSPNGPVLDTALPIGAILSAVGTGTAKEPVPADEQRPAGLDALWATIRDAGRSLGQVDASRPQAAASADAATASDAPARDQSLATSFVSAIASTAKHADADSPSSVERTRGLATALDAVSAGAGRSGLAAAPDIVPHRAAAVIGDAVAVPVGERGWERAFGERVVWLVGQQIQTAEVKLNPPHLGPVEVRLSLTGQDASVSFTVTHGTTRDAIEQAIPRLRELFAEHQLQIVNVDVGQRDASSQASHGDRSGSGGSLSAGVGGSGIPTMAEPAGDVQRGGLPGLVDEYV
jgi:Flagellar hook-length control protein FliK